jgi:hypothetical protein
MQEVILMEEKEKEMKNGKMISDDELDDVAGGRCVGTGIKDTTTFVSKSCAFSFAESGDTACFSVGQRVSYCTSEIGSKYSDAVILEVLDKDGWFCKEFVYSIRIVGKYHYGETGECFEHQLTAI